MRYYHHRFIVILVLCEFFSNGVGAPHPAYLKGEFIFELDDKPTPQCHSSTIVETSAGVLIAAWFGGTREKHPDVGIWLSRFKNGKWHKPIEIANGIQFSYTDGKIMRYPCWNPVLFQAKDGPLMLFYKVGPTPDSWWGILIKSYDSGKTWSTPQRLPDGIIGPVKNKPIQLQDGSILCPSSTEDKGWLAHFEITKDYGNTWSRTHPVNDVTKISAIQPTILVHPHKLQALGRSKQGKIWESWSVDGGKTWSQATHTSLPNPNSGIDGVTLRDGRHILVYNHTTKGRSPLNLAVSNDGREWKMMLTLEDEPGEYSYPAVIQSSDGLIHITYTYKRLTIKHVVVDPVKLK